jgi:phosphoenolpyruvate carboxylase
MTDPHKPLRDDVRLLGELLGETLRRHEGQHRFDAVERIRALAKDARAGDDAAFRRLADVLRAMPLEDGLPIARAFTHFLTLANIAEQHHRIRRRRDYQRDDTAAPQRGSCDEAFPRLVANGVTPERLTDAVRDLRIELVLTAHPTEATRRTIALRNNRIATALATADRDDLTAPERDAVAQTLRREIEAGWATADVRETRPTPLDEVRSGLIVFEQSLWHAVPAYTRAVDRALRRQTGQGLPLDAAPLRFGSWIGGDRDGNPNVTPEVTRRACLYSRWTAAHLYLREVDGLREELSLTVANAALRARTGDAPEPYRALLREVRRRLVATIRRVEADLASERDFDRTADPYGSAREFAADLLVCHESLDESGYQIVAGGRLLDVLRRVAAFGLTLAPLDVRQEAERHTDALSAITLAQGRGAYGDWDEGARIDYLVAALRDGPPIPDVLDADGDQQDVLDTFRTIARIPRESLGAYVITMASRPSDVLAVEYLQRATGVRAPMRASPLFETATDLQNAGRVLDGLLAIPWYRAHVGDRIEVMVGYSDSAKDAGRFAAAWDLHKAQEAIVASARRHAVSVTLFHGRGGSVGRGGGPTHLALMSQPPGSIDGTIRVTEQGEMIQALFGLPDIAQRTMEVYTTGTLEAWLTPAAPPTREWCDRMDRLADAARAAYRETVHAHSDFMEYFRSATPEPELAVMNIGSRPARRRGSASLSGLRAIPWQFAWTQTRLILGAWLGVERALAGAIANGERDALRQMFREWPQFRSAIELIEMGLAKTDGRIAAEYDRRLVPERLRGVGEDLRRRLDLAIACVLDVTGRARLLEETPVLRRSIEVRNPYVDPINLLQVELLHRVRTAGDERARRALMVTIGGVAAGMRNTG